MLPPPHTLQAFSRLEKIATLNFLAALTITALFFLFIGHSKESSCDSIAWQQRNFDAPIAANAGHAFAVPLGTDHASSIGRPSPAIVLEDGRPLPGPANALHDDIRRIGQGRYSFWGTDLLFSSSDNSDPRSNGRIYEVCWPHPWLTNARQALLYFTLGAAVFLPLAWIVTWPWRRQRVQPMPAADGMGLAQWLRARHASPSALLAITLLSALFGLWAIQAYSELNLGVVTMTLGGVPNVANPVIGWSDILNGRIINLESMIAPRQLSPLQGISSGYSTNFADNRLLYPFLALSLLPLFDARTALLAINWLCLVGATLCTYILSLDLFRHRLSAFLAALLMMLSVVWSSFIGNTSAHAANVFYYALGIMLLHFFLLKPTQVLRAQAAGTGMVVALGGVLYTGTLPLVAVTLLCLLRRRQFLAAFVMLVAFLALRNGQSWLISLAGFGSAASDYEIVRLGEALGRHWQMLSTNSIGYAGWLLRNGVQYVGVDNPLVVLLGLLGLTILRAPGRWLYALLLLAMIGAGLAYNPLWGQKGALIFGVVPILHVFAGRLLGLGLDAAWRRGLTDPRALALAISVVAVVASQAAWSAASFLGADFPVRFFFLGYSEPCLFDCRPLYADYTQAIGNMPQPFGSEAGLGEMNAAMATVSKAFSPGELLTAKLRAAIVQSGIWWGLAFILWAFVYRLSLGGTVRVTQITVAIAALLLVLLPHRPIDTSRHIDTFYGLGQSLRQGDRLEGRIRLSNDFISLLQQRQQAAPGLDVFTRLGTYGSSPCLALTIAGVDLAADQPGRTNRLPVTRLLEVALTEQGWVEYTLAFNSRACGRTTMALPSWQPSGAERGREAWLVRADGSRMVLSRFPVLELRLPSVKAEGPAYSVIAF